MMGTDQARTASEGWRRERRLWREYGVGGFRCRGPVLATALAVALAACSDDPMGPDSDSDGAAVAGEVAETTQPESGAEGQWAGDGAAGSAQQAEAKTVAVARARADGSLDVVAEADVAADGSYRVEGVPAGHADLVVVARSGANAEVGRVVLREESRTDAEIRAAPITARTTAEGKAFAELRASGEVSRGDETGELALFVQMEGDAAAQVAAEGGARVKALADAYVEARDAMTEVMARGETALDASARAEILASLVAERDQRSHGGTSVSASHDTYVDAALDAFLDAGVSAEALALATAAAGTAVEGQAGVAGEDAHLELVKTAVGLNLEARSRLAASVSGDGGPGDSKQATLDALADARAGVQASASVDEVRAALRAELERAEGEFEDRVMDALGQVSSELEILVQGRVEGAFEAADLMARVDAEMSASAMADAIVAYRDDVRAEVQALVDELPSEVAAEVDVEAMAALLVAAGACPSVG